MSRRHDTMDETKREKLVSKRSELNKRVLTLEWDKRRNQVSFSKNQMLEDCRKELEKIESELSIENG